MGSFPPDKSKHWKRVLRKLGFREMRVGKGKHAHKFSHPTRKTKDYRIQPNFIIIPSTMHKQLSAGIVKQVMMFGFSLEEIEDAC